MNNIPSLAIASFVGSILWMMVMTYRSGDKEPLSVFNFKRVLSLIPIVLSAWPFYGRLLESKLSGAWLWVAITVVGLAGISVISLAFVVRASSKSNGKEESDKALTIWLITGFLAMLVSWVSAIVTVWVHI